MSVRQLTVGRLIDGHSFCQLLCDGDTVGHAEVQGLFKPPALNQQLNCLLKLPMLERVSKQASQNQSINPWIWSMNLINQSTINQFISQSTKSIWSIDQSIRHQSIHQSINLSIINQPIINQLINQLINQQNRHRISKLRSAHLLKVLCHLVCHLRAGLLTQVLSYLVESIKVTVLETQLQCLWNLACLRVGGRGGGGKGREDGRREGGGW